ncbi:uncharacterized protein LOC117642851 isoform X2 [Thrips palmi]|uniref:Uncharacterized protein LOC117642851 isoform X2 n=1 Tax=Thrips palmi TaxID=161013 RepID=A0A6P8YKR7_THRPL|nr:uncharacterized protein LOC117642851 isoform X2 [Thrips palmi]
MSAAAVTVALNKALAEIAANEGFKKPGFHFDSDDTPPDGFTSLVHRVTITDKEDRQKPSLSVISKTSIDVLAGDLNSQFYATEGHMYKTVLPAMTKIAGFSDPLPWPRCYYTSEPGTSPDMVTLGDLGPEGFVVADRSVRMDEAHCRLALAQLARFHGAGLALQALRPDAFEAMRKGLHNPWPTEESRERVMPFYKGIKITPDVVQDKFPVGSEVNKRLVKLFDAFESNNGAFMDPVAGPGFTLIHSDCHVNNMLFQYDKASGAVKQCRLIDFQMVFHGNPAIDVVLVLFVCTDKPMRDKHWDALLRGYHDEVQAVLKACGVPDPDAVYPWQLLQDQLVTASTYGLCMTPLYHCGVFAGPEVVSEVRDFFNIPENKTKTFPIRVTPTFKSRMEGLVEDVVRWGWLPSEEEVDRRVAAHAAHVNATL